ncbi:TetR/AcrR family transcriptional regulator [Mycobacterium vicinigordonae]|uniref:TetR/AcrR family transcriptional regulator n=1 Tax=Mycobacterium vicinigordonae TaxID=1719132 RepID=A0A7D6IKA7_9MYCO|nr:TetR/AcrR family transcriptional regulator [Mycobacterium vicinigordonae]QLL06160.1 TetR/AcrR family transcriptional regulator [Mycobacterium vicinigordonae]
MRRDTVESQIFDAAARLFAEKGYGGTTLSDIAQAIGVSRTAVYYYVASKEELLSRVVHDVTDAGYAVVSEEIKARSSAPERLRRIAVGMTQLIIANPARFRLLLHSESAMPDDIAHAHRETRRKVLEVLIALIEEGQRSGEFRPVPAREAALALLGMWNWTAFWVHSSTHDLDEIANVFGELAVRGLESRSSPAGSRTPLDVIGAAQEELAALAVMLKGSPSSGS